MKLSSICNLATVILLLVGCSQSTENEERAVPIPKEVVDLGALVTEDLPERLWGKKFLVERGYDRQNEFEVNSFDFADGAVSGSNAYYTFFNHGGPPR